MSSSNKIWWLAERIGYKSDSPFIMTSETSNILIIKQKLPWLTLEMPDWKFKLIKDCHFYIRLTVCNTTRFSWAFTCQSCLQWPLVTFVPTINGPLMMYTLYDDVMTWGQFPQFSPSETGGMPSQNDISLVLASIIICWTNHWWCIHYMMMSWHGDSFHNSVPLRPVGCHHRMTFHWC